MMGAVTVGLLPVCAQAAVFEAGGLTEGLGQAQGFASASGLATNSDVRAIATNVIVRVISFTALLATVAIIAAGIYLIAGFGNDTNRDTAKKIITYTLIGLAIILFARVIIGIVTVILADSAS